ncbi:MAG: SDR family NAD(P)-dependent oxidoreductase, partial [Erysipelotrichaceae bacterium]|nr:SDR family NAD(P)-dependent oxidoreductase [Erysipelotrichaceae bacterium]
METSVLITGASSGLGADFARRYAMEGKNLILTARRLDRLEELKTEIEAKYGVNVEVISADLSSAAGRNFVIDRCLGRVGILV